MSQRKEFGEGIIFTISDYFLWFLFASFYFCVLNIPFLVYIILAVSKHSLHSNLLLLITAIPVGPALTALFSVMGKLVREKDINVTRDFFKAYKNNFFRSLLFWIAELLVITILHFDVLFTKTKATMPILGSVFTVLIVICFAATFYIFPIISRFELNRKDTLKLTFFCLVKRFYIGILAGLLCFLLYVLAVKLSFILALFLISTAIYIIMYCQNKSFMLIESKLCQK